MSFSASSGPGRLPPTKSSRYHKTEDSLQLERRAPVRRYELSIGKLLGPSSVAGERAKKPSGGPAKLRLTTGDYIHGDLEL